MTSEFDEGDVDGGRLMWMWLIYLGVSKILMARMAGPVEVSSRQGFTCGAGCV